ncbi:MAG: bifunctional diguanylate cyclase/phosphohydrolase [Candidatus Limnocylindrales bacterium]
MATLPARPLRPGILNDMLDHVAFPPDLTLAVAGLAVGFIGALIGTAGYALTVGRRQTRRIARLTERLVAATDARHLVGAQGIEDPRLRASFGRLAERVTEAWTLATVDPLTGVLNRQALLTRLEAEIERAARYGHQLSLIIVDLDHFKRLNDSHGHAAGDLVLREISDALRTSVRAIDMVGRYGGEEFMVILPETDVDAAASLAEKLRRNVARRSVVLEDGSAASVTLSAGVAGGFGGHLDLAGLVRDADNAMYSAKALGRDQVYVFHELEDDGLVRRAAIAPGAREQATEVGRAALGAATDSLTAALESRPGWAGRPSSMIAGAAMELARSIGLSDGEIERIRVASLLHDLGKLAIPDEILTKPSELDEPEWRVVAEHPKIGQVVLEQAGALRDAATIVLHHHEWFDGRGYPHGLAGREIPVGARIVAIADAYEAMVAGRPYRDSVTHDQAMAELRRHAGIQFDPELVDLFTDLFAAGMPYAIDPHGHAHVHPPLTAAGTAARRVRGHPAATAAAVAADGRTHAEIHDALHDRRRRVGRPAAQKELRVAPEGISDATTGTTG